MQVSQPRTVRYPHTLEVLPQSLEVFGYFGHTLRAITNTTGRPIRLVLCIEEDELQHVTLARDETVPLTLDAWKCIRARFMPYVVSKETQPITLQLLWDL